MPPLVTFPEISCRSLAKADSSAGWDIRREKNRSLGRDAYCRPANAEHGAGRARRATGRGREWLACRDSWLWRPASVRWELCVCAARQLTWRADIEPI